MVNVPKAILATLAYYNIFELPLTLAEVHQRLINPARLELVRPQSREVTLLEISRELDSLVRTKQIGLRHGFYSFGADQTHLADQRLKKEKITAQKFRNLLRYGRWFQLVPYLRGIFVSGSLAAGTANADSDFDVFVVVRSGRLYLTRILLSLVASMLGVRRTRYEESAPDKFCFNHYIVDAALAMNHRSIYTAQTYAVLVPVMAEADLIQSFYGQNDWLAEFLYHPQPSQLMVRRQIIRSTTLLRLAQWGESFLDWTVGGILEEWARAYQQWRIKNNPATWDEKGRVVFNDREMEFHPRSFEVVVIKKYNEFLRRLSVVPELFEKDSGLGRPSILS